MSSAISGSSFEAFSSIGGPDYKYERQWTAARAECCEGKRRNERCGRRTDSRRQFQRWTKPRARREAHEKIKTELIDLAAPDVGDARLRDAEDFRRLRLRHGRRGQPSLEAHQEHRSNLELLCLRLREQVPKDASPGGCNVANRMGAALRLYS